MTIRCAGQRKVLLHTRASISRRVISRRATIRRSRRSARLAAAYEYDDFAGLHADTSQFNVPSLRSSMSAIGYLFAAFRLILPPEIDYYTA